jgi:hypothetical protein
MVDEGLLEEQIQIDRHRCACFVVSVDETMMVATENYKQIQSRVQTEHNQK